MNKNGVTVKTNNFNKLIIKDKNSIVKYQNKFFKEYINKMKNEI